ncbi:ABC transporter ATP-binding protein [Cryobacterium tagatosivorans]|nr:ABC transporter ATP-binding protein [Cryobacterium tagatosivorans]
MTGLEPAVLDVRDLSVRFATASGDVPAVKNISFQVPPGGSLALLGESGSGKTATARALMGILDDSAVVSGSAIYDGRNLLELTDKQMQRIRGTEIAMIFQDAQSALNPAFTVGWQVAEVFRKRAGLSRSEARTRAFDTLRGVGIPDIDRRFSQYPHQYSGGMRQRVLIAIALALEPRILIADEPTTALDATIEAQILDLIRTAHSASNTALVLISHDLGVVAEMVDRVIVMNHGEMVEEGSIEDVYLRPNHPYTQALLEASPSFIGTRAHGSGTGRKEES